MGQKIYPIINNFSAGELSSRMEGRVDLRGYYQGCRIMKNCLMVAQGGAEKRPGTIYLDSVYDPDSLETRARLIPFEVSDTEIYILELGHRATRIWDAQAKTLVQNGGGDLILRTPYSEDEIQNVQFATTEGKIFLAHENYPFQYIEKTSTGFALIQQFFEVNDWSVGTYNKDDIVYDSGEYWKALRTTTATPAEGDWFSTDYIGATPSADITEYTGGNFTTGDIKLYDGKIYEAIRTYSLGGDAFPGKEVQEVIWVEGSVREKYVNYSETKCKNWFLGIFCTRRESPITYLRRKYTSADVKFVSLGFIGIFIGGWVRFRLDKRTVISTKDSDPYWKLLVGVPNGSDTTIVKRWAAGAYTEDEVVYDPATYLIYLCVDDTSATPAARPEWEKLDNNPFFGVQGDYPSSVAFMNQRLFLGGTKSKPQTVFGSKIADFTEFNLGQDADDALSFKIAADRSSRIRWMIGRDHLLIGTSSDEWIITGGALGITPTNKQVLKQSSYGSAYNQANFVGDTLLFYQKGGRKLNEYIYSNDNRAYLANNLTFYADHITSPGITDSSYQQNPDSILWSIKSDGGLIGLTYDRLNGIAGWHRHDTSGDFESVCSIGSLTDEDELWFIVRREINGVNKRFIEYMASRIISNPVDLYYSDSCSVFSAGLNYVITEIVNNTTSVQVTYTGSTGIVNGDYVKITNTDNGTFDQQVFVVENLNQGSTSGTFDLQKDGLTFTTPAFTTITEGHLFIVEKIITGLDHLLGETVATLGDGAAFPLQKVVADVDGIGGVGIILSSYINKAICGIPYQMILEPEAIEVPGNATLAAKSRVSKVTLKLYKTLGGIVGVPGKEGQTGTDGSGSGYGTFQTLPYRDTSIPFGVPPPLFTGTKEILVDASSEHESRIQIQHSQPFPITILAIISDITYERS